jgi:hypothetical protein
MNKQKVSVEVERKRVWTNVCSWEGWPTVDVPARKNKSESDLFVMVNKTGDTIAITTMKNVLNSPVSAKKTIYTNNEDFFNVDLDKFKFYCKKSGVWKLI